MAVHITERPNALHRGPEAAIDGEEAALVALDSMIRTQEIGIRAAAGRQQQVAACDGCAVR
jgi:hypothetical protein